MLTKKAKNNISVPIRNIEYGLWENQNNSFDFILKEFVIENDVIFEYNFLKRLSHTEFMTNNVIYDRKESLLLNKYVMSYHNIFLVNTNENVLKFLDDNDKKYLFVGYIPYCKPLLDEYINNGVSYEKQNEFIDISNIIYDNDDIQKCINNNGIMDTKDIDTKDEVCETRIKHKDLYFKHLDNIKQSKYARLNVDDQRFINTLIECMILQTIPILDKEPSLVGLRENENFLLCSSDKEMYRENIILNNIKYYNEEVNINQCHKIINHLVC